MKKLLTLTIFQLKDKIDFSWTKKTKTLIQTIVFGVLKFALVAALAFAFLYLLSFIDLYSKYTDLVPIYTVFFTIIFTLSLLSTTMALMKSLYFADDNKVLVTLPATTNQLFFSKIFVYLLFELKKAFSILVPATLGFLIFAFMSYKGSQVGIWTFFWFLLPIIASTFVQVFLGAMLSIPALYIYKFYKKNPIVGLIALIVAVVGGVVLVVLLIDLIPENIDLTMQWPAMKGSFQSFLRNFDKYAYPINFYVRAIFGEQTAKTGLTHYSFSWLTPVKLLMTIGASGVLVGLIYLLIKPFYFKMMSKTFEFDKNPLSAEKHNVRHRKYVTFVNKDLKLSFRDFDVSGAYIAIYIIVPILLLFMDKVISAISTSLRGNNIALAVNVLLTILPLLASNSMIATFNSKEGRAAYYKKTDPVNPIFPLISKLLFNLALSIPSIGACAFIIERFAGATIFNAIVFAFFVLLIQYAHIFYSTTQDVMNPQNEAYATSGSDFNNPNETKVTIVAFVGSFVLALVSYFLFKESQTHFMNYDSAFIRLLMISILAFAGSLSVFVLKVKAFYFEK